VSIKLTKTPDMHAPVLVAAWPGIGNVGINTVNELRKQVNAEKIGELEAWEFFYPYQVQMKGAVLECFKYPACDFYYHNASQQDILFFLADAPPESSREAHQMAIQVMEVAQRFHCWRVYTSAAAIFPIHHSDRPKVHVVASSEFIIKEFEAYSDTVLGIGDPTVQGIISGMNGVLLDQAKRIGIEAVCLMGAVPDYLAGVPFPLPRVSREVYKVFLNVLGLGIIPDSLEEQVKQIDDIIAQIYSQIPLDARNIIDGRKQTHPDPIIPITDQDTAWIKENIGDFFKHPPIK
jgi:proteasome assembly chaperone (PAC2) family protein